MLRKLNRDGRCSTFRIGAAAGLVAALGMAGCGADYVTGSQATVLLLVADINSGSPIASDVRGDTGQITNCSTKVKVANIPKNPNDPGGRIGNVLLNRYDVAFTRSDGRGVPGLDVPYPFSAAIAATIPNSGDQEVTLNLVRQQAKLEPPLSNITGLQIVAMTATVTVYGNTVSGQAVSASGAVEVRFADYRTGTTTCEGS